VATIERAADVLFLFAKAPGTLGVTDIAQELDISKAVVHRIVTSLGEHDLVIADPATRRYSLGHGVLQLAAGYLDNLDVRAMALETMKSLSSVTNETATLSVRHGDKRVYVDQVMPSREVKLTVQVAAAFPLHAGASSKAFLAWMSAEEVDAYLADNSLDALTDETIVSETELRKELEGIRKQGFAVSLGERQVGAGSVAAPILDHHNNPVAVISVCGPAERFRDEVADAATALVEATRELSGRLGAQPEAS
jgi:DNA-binding IclR family transcriptional regulator